ncbi:MAG: DUF1460 domain-containing protein [Deltaproteobacteria bacterium]|nr:DUF1460 domain-containing protein [Deltaproteobacteria bacterium]
MPPGPRAEPEEVRALLAFAEGCARFEARLDRISLALLGRPYVVSPLLGAPEEPERMVTRLDAFDCVTWAEAVWALAGSRDPVGFERRLTALRYAHGRVDWHARNHYMHAWIAHNESAGLLAPILPALWEDTGEQRVLTALAGHPPVPWRVRALPVARLPALVAVARPGDLVAFVSRRPDLDAFHVGLLAPGPVLGLRHAARSRGGSVEEPLEAFLEHNDVPGLLVARPLPPTEILT